jgi:hypothetical protein
MTKFTIKSKPLNYPKHIFLGVIVIWALYMGISNDSTTGYAIAGILGGFMLLEMLLYSRITLKSNENELIVRKVTLIGTKLDNYTIRLEDIRATHYEVEKYDTHALFHYFFLEMLFPSGRSTFTILKMDDKKQEFNFNANEQEVRKFMEKLPDRVPNG